MESPPKFVWLLFSGNDDEPGISENFEDVYSCKSKAKKGAQEIMDGYFSPPKNWWKKTHGKDEIIWNWFYEVTKKTDSGTYVRIMKCEIK